MLSRKALSCVAVGVWAAVALSAAPRAFWHRHTVAGTRAADRLAANCTEIHMKVGDRETIYDSEERSITRAEADTLRVEAQSNGGLQVQGWEKDNYSVTLCKAAESGSDAQDLLSQIHMTVRNGEVGVRGPASRRRWGAYLLVRTPHAASLEVSVNNGPLALYNVDGNLKARAVNGPITVSDCSGDLDLTAQNGPISLEGNSGKLRVRTDNGPLTLALQKPGWKGAGVEAHSTNGPVHLTIPAGYGSGVVLESDGHGPFRCEAEVCGEGRKTWDEGIKRIEFGTAPVVVRISTVNGPVSVD
jgi:hypothetical protein